MRRTTMRSNRSWLLAAATISALWIAQGAAAVPFNLVCPAQNDVDTDPATVVTCISATSGGIQDLNVQLNIDENPGTPYVSDLTITLTHVATGTTVTLYVGDQVFNPAGMMDVTLDDAAAAAVPTTGDAIGTFQPTGLLADFNGLDLAGQWDLTIEDTFFPGEGLDLLSWSLVGQVVPEPGTGVLLAGGLAGLAVSGRSRRRTAQPA